MTQKKNNLSPMAKEAFDKGSPLAHVIWERDELREGFSTPKADSGWISKLTRRTGKIAHEVEKEKEMDLEKLCHEVTKTASLCLLWIEDIRKRKKN